ncbi:MAG: hypothetical protein WA892_05970 [Ornithinimicrobium sp.]
MATLDAAIRDHGELLSELSTRLEAVRSGWARVNTSVLSRQAYWVQTYRPGDPGPGEPLTDALLGHGWFYADVAHADPTGEKRRVFEVSLKERYAAGVSVWSRITLVILSTLRLIEDLQSCGVLELPQECFTETVAVDPRTSSRKPPCSGDRQLKATPKKCRTSSNLAASGLG